MSFLLLIDVTCWESRRRFDMGNVGYSTGRQNVL